MIKYCFIDVETTGLTEKHGIIQIAGAIVKREEDSKNLMVWDQFSFRCQPFRGMDLIADEALAVNGVTREQMETFPPPTVIYSKLVEILGAHCDKFDPTDKMFFTGYNAEFDNQRMREWFKKNNDDFFGSWFFNPAKDVMQLALDYLEETRYTMKNFKLGTVATKMGITSSGNLHEAGADIELTMKIFAQIKDYKIITQSKGV